MSTQSIIEQLERDEHGVGVVLAAIPFGSENAIKRRDLCARLGMNDRQVRKLIELARAGGNMKNADGFALSPNTKKEVTGFFTESRVDRNTISEGWYAYDFRHNDNGNLCALEPSVLVNHGGTFLTQQEVQMNKDGYHSLRGRGGYTFL